MTGRRRGRMHRRADSPPKKRSALVQMLLRDDDEPEEVPEQFNIVQEYCKLRQELLARIKPPAPLPRPRRCAGRTGGVRPPLAVRERSPPGGASAVAKKRKDGGRQVIFLLPRLFAFFFIALNFCK
jgi:hypothetical protein